MSAKKLKYEKLTREEWQNSLRCSSPHRNRKKYFRKEKHRGARNSASSFVYLG